MIRAAHSALRGHRRFAIGAIPAGIWGVPRHSRDLDLVVLVAPAGIVKLLAALRQGGFLVLPISNAVLEQGKTAKVKWSKRRRLSVDLSMVRTSLDKSALARRVHIRFLGLSFPIASPEDTVLYKLARFWDQDRADIRAILLRQRLDWAYMGRMAERYSQESGSPSMLKALRQITEWESRE